MLSIYLIYFNVTLTSQSGQFDLPVYINKLVLHETLCYTDVLQSLEFWLEIESLEFWLEIESVRLELDFD